MGDQEQVDFTALVARLAGGEGKLTRREVFAPPPVFSQGVAPPVAYAGGISVEHYGEAARCYGTHASHGYYDSSLGPEANQWGVDNPRRGANHALDPITWVNLFPDVDDMGQFIKPPDYRQWLRDKSEEAELSRRTMLLWLAEAPELQNHTANPWRKANAIALMKTAKEEMLGAMQPI